ncbi:MAG: YbaB/EbfC family nucleoid-associated protein [Chlamydiia bacterium]|nr:YbaB/EbfC family nucleoid-associated protein [Chlamydiia bacterium]MCP5510102.1 YbaB/EbfC family nucleoid-associated protein [Chlamydiales bacterium]
MKKQAKQMQDQVLKMQKEMEALEVTGIAGSGLVSLALSGDKKLKNISIQPDCVDPTDVEGLQDLIMAAYEDALAKLEESSPMAGMPFGF